MKKKAEQKEHKVPNDKELFEILLRRKWYFAMPEQLEDFETELRYSGISIKTKLIMWFANSLHHNRKNPKTGVKYPCYYQSQSIAAILGTTYNTMKPHLIELTKQGLFHHCEKDGFKSTEWRLGTTDNCPNCQEIRDKKAKKEQIELSLVDVDKTEVKDGFIEVERTNLNQVIAVKDDKVKLDKLISSGISNYDNINNIGLSMRYKQILEACGIYSTSQKPEIFMIEKTCKELKVNPKDIDNKLILRHVLKFIYPMIIEGGKIPNTKIYATNLIKKFHDGEYERADESTWDDILQTTKEN